MTVPVSTRYYKVREGENGEQEMWERTMCFYLTREVQVNPPQPQDEEVFLQTRPKLTVFTRYLRIIHLLFINMLKC